MPATSNFVGPGESVAPLFPALSRGCCVLQRPRLFSCKLGHCVTSHLYPAANGAKNLLAILIALRLFGGLARPFAIALGACRTDVLRLSANAHSASLHSALPCIVLRTPFPVSNRLYKVLIPGRFAFKTLSVGPVKTGKIFSSFYASPVKSRAHVAANWAPTKAGSGSAECWSVHSRNCPRCLRKLAGESSSQ